MCKEPIGMLCADRTHLRNKQGVCDDCSNDFTPQNPHKHITDTVIMLEYKEGQPECAGDITVCQDVNLIMVFSQVTSQQIQLLLSYFHGGL